MSPVAGLPLPAGRATEAQRETELRTSPSQPGGNVDGSADELGVALLNIATSHARVAQHRAASEGVGQAQKPQQLARAPPPPPTHIPHQNYQSTRKHKKPLTACAIT